MDEHKLTPTEPSRKGMTAWIAAHKLPVITAAVGVALGIAGILTVIALPKGEPIPLTADAAVSSTTTPTTKTATALSRASVSGVLATTTDGRTSRTEQATTTANRTTAERTTARAIATTSPSPTAAQAAAPIPTPTKAPTKATAAPTNAPTAAPTKAPTAAPTKPPTAAPTAAPTKAPTAAPTKRTATCAEVKAWAEQYIRQKYPGVEFVTGFNLNNAAYDVPFAWYDGQYLSDLNIAGWIDSGRPFSNHDDLTGARIQVYCEPSRYEGGSYDCYILYG